MEGMVFALMGLWLCLAATLRLSGISGMVWYGDAQKSAESVSDLRIPRHWSNGVK